MKIAVIFPVYGEYQQGFIGSLMSLLVAGSKNQYVTISPSGASNITSARNLCIQSVLVEEEKTGKFDKLLWIDTDIIFTNQDVEKMIDSKKEVISGVYFKKGGNYGPVAGYYDLINVGNGFPEVSKKDIVSNEIVEVDWVGMGFVLMNREIIDKIEYPWYDMRVVDLPTPIKRGGGLMLKKELLSEDISFCCKIKEAGFKIWLDTSVKLKHIGKTNYSVDHFLAVN